MENDLTGKANALRKENELLKGLLKNSRDFLYRMSLPGGEYEYISPAVSQVFGYSPEEMYQSPKHIQKVIHPDWAEYLDTQWQRLIAGDMLPSYEYQIIHKSGDTRWIYQKNVLIKDESGTPVAIEGIVSDITDQKRMQAENDRLEESNRQARHAEAVGRLAGGVAHVLNNLLMPMIGYAEMLMEDLAPDKVHRGYAKQIVNSGFRAKDLVDQLMAYASCRSLDLKRLDMNTLVKGMEKALRRALREDIGLRILPSKGLQTVRGDPKHIQQAIKTLVINAQNAMPEGGSIIIETARATPNVGNHGDYTMDESGSHVMLTVSDTGCGMDEETREKIFDPFFSASGVVTKDLGLATVYGIVKQHGGRIFLDSKPGEGTVVRILLLHCRDRDEDS
jgi:PAS domain S-box-containing protein